MYVDIYSLLLYFYLENVYIAISQYGNDIDDDQDNDDSDAKTTDYE